MCHQSSIINFKSGGNTVNTGTRKMKKQVKVQVTEDGQKYFTIYEVRVRKHNGEIFTHHMFLNKKDAEQSKEDVYKIYSENYDLAWIKEQIVWC